jgi:hypothetical protein
MSLKTASHLKKKTKNGLGHLFDVHGAILARFGLYICIAGVGLGALTPNIVSADIGSTYYDTSSSYDTSGTTNYSYPNMHAGSGDGFIQDLGTGLSGNATGYTVAYTAQGGETRTLFVLWECPTSNYASSSCSQVFSEYHVIQDFGDFHTYDFGTGTFTTGTYPIPFDPTKWYFFNVGDNTTTIGTRIIRSSSLDTYPGGDCHRNCGSAVDLAFTIHGVGTSELSSDFEISYITPYISIIEPTFATTTATTSVYVEINFSTPLSLDFRPTTTRTYTVWDAVTNELEYIYQQDIPPNASENIVYTNTITLSEGSKFLRAAYFDKQGNLYSDIAEQFFNVATNTYQTATGLETPYSSPGELTQINCTLFEIGCQIQKALTFLFIPSQEKLTRFSTLWQSIQTKVPFGYVTVTINQLKNLDTDGTAQFSLGTLPFQSLVFDPFKTGLASILWGLYAIFFYKNRLTQLDI